MSKTFRFFAMILTFGILLGSLPASVSASGLDKWSKASSYMLNELREAQANGLIPDILSGTDFTQSMTRAEFAHLIVLMLETYSGVSTQPETLTYPFKDTDDPVVFKAFGFGIMDRTNDADALFSPDAAIDRETMSYMACRAIRLIAPLADYNVSVTPGIPDIDVISSFARQSVMYLYSRGIINGGNNRVFMPRPTTDEQVESNYGVATREQCVVLANRIYEALPQIQSTRFDIKGMAAEVIRYALDEPQNGVEISRDDLWNILNPISWKVRWGSNTHALSFAGDFVKVGDGEWEQGYDSFFMYNAFSSDGPDQCKFDEQQTLWGAGAGDRRFALTVFDADAGTLSAYEWNSGSDAGTLVNMPMQSANLFSPLSLRDYLPSRIDWTYHLYDDTIINDECCKVFSVTTKENLIQGEGANLPEHWVEETVYFYVSTVSGLNILKTNYSTLRETTYLVINIVFTISASLTDASVIEPPQDITFSPSAL